LISFSPSDLKEQGVRFGAKPELTAPQVNTLRQKRSEGVLIKTLMAEYGLSKASVYGYLADASSLQE